MKAPGASTRRWTGAVVFLSVLLALVGVAAAKPPHHAHGSGPRHHRGSGSANPGKPIAIGFGFRPQVLVDEAGVAHITYASPGGRDGPAGENELQRRLGQLLPPTAGRRQMRRPRPLRRADRLPGEGAGRPARPVLREQPRREPGHRRGRPAAGDRRPAGDPRPPARQRRRSARRDQRRRQLPLDLRRRRQGVHRPGAHLDDGLLRRRRRLRQPVEHRPLRHDRRTAPRTRRPSGTCSSRRCGRGRSRRRARGSTSAAAKTTCWRGARSSPTATARWSPSTTSSDVFVREYKGKGDIDDAANWTTSKFPGVDPSLASGPHGTWLTYYPPGGSSRAVVVKLVDGQPLGSHGHRCSRRCSKATKINSPRPPTVSWSPAGSEKAARTTNTAT